MKPEYRVISKAQIRAKKTDGKTGIEGTAAVFNQLSVDLGWYRERIMPGAFTDCLNSTPDVKALFNHDPNIVLGRTTSKTLRLKEDNTGLQFDADPPDTQAARDVVTLIDRGDVDQCSFGFYVRDYEWTQEPDHDDPKKLMLVRKLKKVDVFDVSPVTFPAYPQTSCDTRTLRSLFPQGVPDDVREHVPSIIPVDAQSERRVKAAAGECDCKCAACQDGECEECSNTECDSAECDGCPMQGEENSKRADAKTKRVDGEDLKASAFAFVGDDSDTSTWKLPIKFSTDEKTKRHIRNALSRFSQTKGISADEKPKGWKRIVAAAKKHDIKVSEEDSVRAGFVPDSEIEKMKMRVQTARASL
jgi:uncharacterized protein